MVRTECLWQAMEFGVLWLLGAGWLMMAVEVERDGAGWPVARCPRWAWRGCSNYGQQHDTLIRGRIKGGEDA